MRHSSLARIGFLLLFTATVIGTCRTAAADFAKEFVVKAAISLNLARFTEWPESVLPAGSNFLNLCVLGDEAVQQAFAQVEKKASGKRLIHVIAVSQSSKLGSCNMIYLSGLDRIGTIKLLADIAGKPILSIGERNDFLELGGLINLEMKEGKINIQVNLDAVNRSGIKISSRVLSLATIINVKKTRND